MFDKFKKKSKNKNKKNKNVNKIFAKIVYVFQARVVDFAQNFDFEFVCNAIVRLEYIDKEKNVVVVFKIVFELIKIVFASVAIAKNSILIENN